MPDGLLAALRAMIAPGVGAASADPRRSYPLLSGESLPHAIPSRLREFSAGRHAARGAMAAIGLSPLAIPQGTDRAPLWPTGVIGSITHSADACLAVALRAGDVAGIGIDLEPALALDPALWEIVLLPQERAWVEQKTDPALCATQIFSVKEAVFKAHYSTTRSLTGFEVMAVSLENGRFVATFQTALSPFAKGFRVYGRIGMVDGHILTLATL